MVMKPLFDSLVRTVVPYVVGAVVAFFATTGLSLDSEFAGHLTVGLTTLFGTIYYAGARLLEIYVQPKFGWLLGIAKAPAYADKETKVTPTVET